MRLGRGRTRMSADEREIDSDADKRGRTPTNADEHEIGTRTNADE